MSAELNRQLLSRLTVVRRWLGIGDATETFEDIADWFYQDTGIMRPGQSQPMEMCGHSDEERRDAFHKWADEKRAVVMAAINEAIDMVQPLPPECSICRRRHGSEVQHACE